MDCLVTLYNQSRILNINGSENFPLVKRVGGTGRFVLRLYLSLYVPGRDQENIAQGLRRDEDRMRTKLIKRNIYLQGNDSLMMRFFIKNTWTVQVGPTSRKCQVIELVLILNLSQKLVDKDFIASPLRMIMEYLSINK